MFVTQALVRATTAEDIAYAEASAALDARTRRLADVQAELEALRQALARFANVILHRARTMFVELDRVRLSIEEFEHRLALLAAASETPDADEIAAIEDAIRQEFGARRERLEEGREANRRQGNEVRRERARPPVAPEVAAELRRLYRDLARRHHPDLARGDAERAKRERVMLRINAAFRDRDLNALRGLHRAAEAADPAFDARPVTERLAWTVAEVARLDAVIAGLEDELAATIASDTHGFWLRHEAGEPVVHLLEEEAGLELAARRKRLAAITSTYRRACKMRSRR